MEVEVEDTEKWKPQQLYWLPKDTCRQPRSLHMKPTNDMANRPDHLPFVRGQEAVPRYRIWLELYGYLGIWLSYCISDRLSTSYEFDLPG